MNKICIFALISVVVLAGFMGSAQAYNEIGLEVTDPVGNSIGTETNPVEVCPCVPITPELVKVVVTNSGTETDTAHLSLEVPEGWTGQIQSTVTLASGESQALSLLLINPPGCNVQAGDYVARITAESGVNSQAKTTKELHIRIMKCYFVSLDADPEINTCTEAEPVTVDVNITNEGKWSEVVDLSANIEWAEFSETTLNLASGETKTVQVVLDPPEGFVGTQNVEIKAESQISYASDTKTTELNVLDCYDFELGLEPEEAEVCIAKKAAYTLKIKNTGINADVYSVSSPEWVSIDGTASAGPDETAEINLEIAAEQAGERDFEITVSSQNDAELSKTVSGVLKVNECRDVVVIASPSEVTACRNIPADFNVIVKNRGTVEDVFELTATSGSLDKNKVVLPAKQSEEISLNIDTSDMEEGEYEISVTAATSDGSVSDTSVVKLIVENCYSAELTVTPENQSICRCTSTDYNIRIENTGELADRYTVTMDGFEKEVFLESGESEEFAVEYPITYGPGESREITVTAESDNVKLEKTVILGIKPEEECFDVELYAEGVPMVDGAAAVEVCNSTVVPLKIKNTGERTEIFLLSVTGPDWMYIVPEEVLTLPGDEKDAYLYIAPPYGVETGVYSAFVNVESANLQKELKVVVSVVPNITEENITIKKPGEKITINLTGTNLTGGVITGEERPVWKTAVVAVITVIIILILVIRFVFLIK